MNVIVVVCVVVLTIAVVTGVVFLIQTLIQVKRTAGQAELLMRSCNEEIGIVKSLTSNVSSVVTNFKSPWFKVGAWAMGMASAFLKKSVNNYTKKTKDKEGQDVK
jgi:hypothetical protein